MTKVSLIITTFNRPHLLPRAVYSALRAADNVEVIVVDDASQDETAAVCNKLRGIKYIRLDRNQGVAGARNVGILASKSDYVSFLDDDDLRLPGSLDDQVRLLEAAPAAAFAAGAVLLADQDCRPTGQVAFPGAESGDIFWRVIQLSVHLIPDSVVVRKECFAEVGLFHWRLAGIDDWDMWTRLAAHRPAILDDKPVCIYRCATPQSGQGSSHQAAHLRAAIKHQRKLFLLPRARAAEVQFRKSIRRETKRRIADTLSWRAAEQLPRGEIRFAAANFLAALCISPRWAARPTHARILWRSIETQRENRRNYVESGADLQTHFTSLNDASGQYHHPDA
jgi:hypothetical protein